MRKLFKKIIVGLQLFAASAYAGLPPTTVKGQYETNPATTFFFQAPYNQATTTAGVTRLIETGYQNLLLNPSFEHSTFDTSWTTTTGTQTVETTNIIDGKKSYHLALSSQTGSMSQSVTPSIQLQGQDMEYSCMVKTTLTTAQVIGLQAGSEVGVAVNAPSDGLWHRVLANYPGPSSGSVGVKVKTSASATGDIYIDDCYVGKARNIGTASVFTDFVAYTPTFTGFGTVSNVEIYSRREGDSLRIQGRFQLGTSTATEARMTLGFAGVDNNVTAASLGSIIKNVGTYFRGNNTVNGRGGALMSEQGLGYLTFGSSSSFGPDTAISAFAKVNGSTLGSSSDVVAINALIPITGWTGQQVVRVDNSNYDWTDYSSYVTSNTNGLGTPSAVECLHSRSGPDLLIRCKLTSGSVTAAEMRVPLPSGLTSADTTRIPSIQECGGVAAFDQTFASPVHVLCEPSVSYVTFGVQSGSAAGLTKQNGNVVFGSSGQKISFIARVPIQGWTNNQSAALLVGSVTSNTSGLERIERANITCSSSSAINSQSGSWLTSVGNVSSGKCVVTLAISFASTAYDCQFTRNGTATTSLSGVSINNKATGSFDMYMANISSGSSTIAAGTNETYDLICMGPR